MKRVVCLLSGCFLLVITVLAPPAGAQQNRADWIQWIPLCGKCLAPSIAAKSGLGTAHAVAEGKVTLKNAQEWCDNWQPGDTSCATQQLASEKGKTYRISADCPAGRLTSVDGKSYRYAGVWNDHDIGGGRPKFRGVDGKIVPRDEASGGLTLAAQWELLCLSREAKKNAGARR